MKLEKTVRLAIFKKLQFKFVSIFLKVCTRAFFRNPKTNAHFGNRKSNFCRKKNAHIGTIVTKFSA